MQVFLFWAAALRKGEKEMKVVVKRVVIENEEFALIKDTCERGVYYGTIPYSLFCFCFDLFAFRAGFVCVVPFAAIFTFDNFSYLL